MLLMSAASVAVSAKRNALCQEQVLCGLPLQEKTGIPKMLCPRNLCCIKTFMRHLIAARQLQKVLPCFQHRSAPESADLRELPGLLQTPPEAMS